jgi:hypothetical protein
MVTVTEIISSELAVQQNDAATTLLSVRKYIRHCINGLKKSSLHLRALQLELQCKTDEVLRNNKLLCSL